MARVCGEYGRPIRRRRHIRQKTVHDIPERTVSRASTPRISKVCCSGSAASSSGVDGGAAGSTADAKVATVLRRCCLCCGTLHSVHSTLRVANTPRAPACLTQDVAASATIDVKHKPIMMTICCRWRCERNNKVDLSAVQFLTQFSF